MDNFFKLEGAYIVLGAFVVLITIFVTTRSFMSKGALKKGLFFTISTISLMILLHYFITTSRMEGVRKAFESGKEVLCENRIYTKAAQFVTIKDNGNWKIVDDNFVSPFYERPFFLARCIEK